MALRRLILSIALLSAASACQASPTETEAELLQAVAELRAEVATLKRTVARLEAELSSAKPPSAVPAKPAQARQPATAAKTQCMGATASGARCKRSPREGSRYCWQHAGK